MLSPPFNASDEFIEDVKDAGINIVSTANNHAMDTGELEVKRTYKIGNEKGIKTVGTAQSSRPTKYYKKTISVPPSCVADK